MAKKAKGRDFYGQEVTKLIDEACREFDVSQEELDIEVLETGSAGIFGLCRKKAHIRVRLKEKARPAAAETEPAEVAVTENGFSETGAQQDTSPGRQNKAAQRQSDRKKHSAKKKKDTGAAPKETEKKNSPDKGGHKRSQEPVQPPSDEAMARVKADICELLELMGYPSEVTLQVEDTALRCHISGEHEEVLVGSEGRTLDSMQYLLRKMMAGVLPERMMLSLDAGDFRRRRAEELKERALALAEEVRETGKTQAIPALNPAERREVHMILQEDKTIRSRSVGDGLFKKVLIYKPGSKSGRPSRKRKRRSSGRSKEN